MPPPESGQPTIANYDSAHLTIGAGVAIFHLASGRVVLCYHTTEHYWFLPKGRRNAGEDSGRGAEREGFEESGYRNRLLPLPMAHRQPQPHNAGDRRGGHGVFGTEPVWMQLAPLSKSVQYILFWYIAETLPPALEEEQEALTKNGQGQTMGYESPPPFEADRTLQERIGMEPQGYEPVRHENTGVDDEEALYTSRLMNVEEAIKKLGVTSISADVVRRGWEGIQRRRMMEEEEEEEGRALD
ncbi:MAG: hypothetical protein Q9163_002362 [Psora crenata]